MFDKPVLKYVHPTLDDTSPADARADVQAVSSRLLARRLADRHERPRRQVHASSRSLLRLQSHQLRAGLRREVRRVALQGARHIRHTKKCWRRKKVSSSAAIDCDRLARREGGEVRRRATRAGRLQRRRRAVHRLRIAGEHGRRPDQARRRPAALGLSLPRRQRSGRAKREADVLPSSRRQRRPGRNSQLGRQEAPTRRPSTNRGR